MDIIKKLMLEFFGVHYNKHLLIGFALAAVSCVLTFATVVVLYQS